MMLADRIAWVTGASRGIGRETALALAAEGATVVLSARRLEHLDETAAEVARISGREPVLLAYDSADVAAIKGAFSEVQKRFNRLDVMVNNAGMLEESLLGMITPAMLEKTFAVNTFSVVYHTQYASRLMARAKAGSIINVSSIIGRFGKEGLAVYGASKAAVIGLTFSAAKELAPLNIRVNALAPGLIETDMVRGMAPDKYAERLACIKMKRAGRPEEVAQAVLFLASDMSSYVTGQVIGVDGGMIE